MAQQKLLVDANAYFRLAQSIHPLLGCEFGDDRFCLYLIPELRLEIERDPRLVSKFPWVSGGDYAQNRRKQLSLSKENKTRCATARSVIAGHAAAHDLGVSPEDIFALATAFELGIPVVTDDGDMLELARAFQIQAMTTLELLDLMVRAGFKTKAEVAAIAGYWRASGDCPRNFAADYRRLFGEPVVNAARKVIHLDARKLIHLQR